MFLMKSPGGNAFKRVKTQFEKDRWVARGWVDVTPVPEEPTTETEEPTAETEEPAAETEEPAASVVTEEVPEAQPPKKSKKATAKKADKE